MYKNSGLQKLFASALCLSGVALISSPSLASEKPRTNSIEINITYSDKLEKEFKDNYGLREKKAIEETIRKELAEELGKNAVRADIVVIDAKPNRPTFEQLGNTPGLSLQSFSIGGAELSGRTYDAYGNVLSVVNYEYTSPSIIDARMAHTWHDAEYAIYRFARRLATD